MIYFDNAASSPMREEVLRVFCEEARRWGNPSSLHRLGFEAEQRLKTARKHVAKAIFASPEEIVFTSGGTEADNLAIFGAVRKMGRRGKKILATDSEHPAVEECLRQLEREGFTVIRLSTRGGELDPDEIAEYADSDTIFAALMHTNNETGAVYDIATASRIIKEKNPEALVFSDAVQALFHSPLDPARLGVDLMSLSSHKINGPKGAGALYVKKGLNLPPLLLGGGQERGLRNGTEAMANLVAFGEACRLGAEEAESSRKRMRAIRDRICEALGEDSRVFFNEPAKSSCHILSMQVAGFRSEVLLHRLSQRDIFVSSGSACSSHKGKSEVLTNFGLRYEESDRTVRLSFSPLNTLEEAEEFIRILKEEM